MFTHGVLRILLPKAEESRLNKVAITAGGQWEAITAGSITGCTSYSIGDQAGIPGGPSRGCSCVRNRPV